MYRSNRLASVRASRMQTNHYLQCLMPTCFQNICKSFLIVLHALYAGILSKQLPRVFVCMVFRQVRFQYNEFLKYSYNGSQYSRSVCLDQDDRNTNQLHHRSWGDLVKCVTSESQRGSRPTKQNRECTSWDRLTESLCWVSAEGNECVDFSAAESC